MPRFERMDELLQRVRQQLGAFEPGLDSAAIIAPVVDLTEQHYAALLEAMLVLLRDAEELRDVLHTGQQHSLNQAQQDDLIVILGKVLRELWQSKAELEAVKPQD